MSDSGSDSSGMDRLLELAQGVGEMPQDQSGDQILRFSSELTAMAARLSELTREKLQMEFENRELKARMVPVQIELESAKEQIRFSKNQNQEFWAEIEALSKQKSDVWRERCEMSRKLSDEIASLSADRESDRSRLEQSELEREKLRQELAADRAEYKAKLDGVEVESLALREKVLRQENLIAVLEKQHEVTEKLQTQVVSLERELGAKNLDLMDITETADALRAEKEELLQQLVMNRENKKAVSAVDTLLGKGTWNLSSLVDALTEAKAQVGEKRKEVDSLRSVIEEMQEKLPSVEAVFAELQQCKAELEDTKQYNAQIQAEFEQREEAMDQLRFDKMRIETDHQSLQLRSAETGKQLAILIHESESLRSRLGYHAGPGRSYPSLVSSAPVATVATVASPEAVPHFRTVHDLVEQNTELKDKMDRLLNESETAAQQEVQKLRVQQEKLQSENSELLAKRAKDKSDFDRTTDRLESELRRARTESEKLRKFFSLGAADIDMQGEDENAALVRKEFKKHLGLVNAELETARQVYARTVSELDRVRQDVKREIDEKNHCLRAFERVKAELSAVLEKEKTVRSRLNAVEIQKESLHAKLEQIKGSETLFSSAKRDLEHQIEGLKALNAAHEKAYRDLAAEKETQSAVLVGYHSRLDQESRMYHTNSEALKKLYEQEFEKSKSTLNFYQTAYEEQVKRANELSAQINRVNAEMDLLRSQAVKIRVLSAAETPAASPSGGVFSSPVNAREVLRLEAELKSVSEDAVKWRDIARVNEELVDQLRAEIDQKEAQIAELNSARETSEADIQMTEDHGVVDALSAQVDALSVQLEEKTRELAALCDFSQSEYLRFSEEINRLKLEADKVKSLEESLHKERLVLSVKQGEFAEKLSEVRIKSDLAQQERNACEQRIALLIAENERYLRYFASDLSSSEKEEEGKLVIEQLQSSLSKHSLRESQLLSDLQRCRSTLDMLLRENQSLKAVHSERDALLVQIKVAEERLGSTLSELDRVKSEFENVSSAYANSCEQLASVQEQLQLLASAKEQLGQLETDQRMVEEQLEQALSQASEFKQLHADLALKVAGGETELLAETQAKVVQLEKAKSQLTQTVSRLREEAEKKTIEIASLCEKIAKLELEVGDKSREIARQDGLMKLKDKRISELETAPEPSEHVKQLMDLVSDYQMALAALQIKTSSASVTIEQPAGDEPVSPSVGTARKRRKAEEDENEGMQLTQE